MGRPSEYSDAVAAEILERLSEGQSLRTICSDDRLPHRSTIFRWLAARPDFAAGYAYAKEMGCELIAETALEEALAATPATAQVERLRWDARRWHVSKLHPRRFGDKVQAELSGRNGSAVKLQAVPTMMVPTQVAQAVRDLIDKAEVEMGLAPGAGTDQERLQRLLTSGQPVPPDVYEIMHGGKE
jgi:hypothetical protein